MLVYFDLQLDDKAYLVHKEKMEKDRLTQDFKARIALTEQQYTKHMVSHSLKKNNQIIMYEDACLWG